MNIKEAKENIKNTVSVYLKKDEYGEYRIPTSRQRPIFLLGAPGIGKTAIMEQIADEMGIALVSYSMTHHTRQSALGLPFINTKEYGGQKYSVSEYTMSEIIASVYDTMEQSGVKEGILFLDEINCVSETLYPSMLQFLQFKVFGRHSVPEGWIVVTAGNPPEYNRSVRNFDVVTLDRLKVMEIEPDYQAWKNYASSHNIHPAVLGFLDKNKRYFYMIESTVSGPSYVTARGWEDLSTVISLYEESDMSVTGDLIGQYIKNEQVSREFWAYYDLYRKYEQLYRISEVLGGDAPGELLTKVQKSSVDERLSIASALTDSLKKELKRTLLKFEDIKEIQPLIKAVLGAKTCYGEGDEDVSVSESLKKLIEARNEIIRKKQSAGTLTYENKQKQNRIKALYGKLLEMLEASESKSASTTLQQIFNEQIENVRKEVSDRKVMIANYFGFMKRAFGEESNEMLLGVTELTINENSAKFLNAFGSEEYENYSKLLLVNDRAVNLREEIMNLKLQE